MADIQYGICLDGKFIGPYANYNIALEYAFNRRNHGYDAYVTYRTVTYSNWEKLDNERPIKSR